jgi:hypothetical protein
MAKKKKKKPRVRKPKPHTKKRRKSQATRSGSRAPDVLPPLVMVENAADLMPGKMSEVLAAVARPALDEMPEDSDLDRYRMVFSMAALAWNISRRDTLAEGREAIRQAVKAAGLTTAQDREDMETVLTDMTERARTLWPGHMALAANVEVQEEENGDLRILAMSVLPAPKGE